ncbi:FRG domain-containing protein [Vibrio vulnificus]|nr:FRG domain-containing protein [Vibrio vulnificus]
MNGKFEIKRINTISDFKSFVDLKPYRKWIYRGQSSSDWKLESSLFRAINDAAEIRKLAGEKSQIVTSLNYEEIMLERFKSGAHLFLEHLPKTSDTLSWLAVMQHHGAPTRFLDFSFSAYIALYFAVESGSGDSAIYCIDHSALKRVDNRHFGDERKNVYKRVMVGETTNDEMCLFAFEPEFYNKRLLAQQGLFLVPNHLQFSHEQILNEYKMPPRSAYKLIISKELRYKCLELLNQLNITSGTIYPGLDGFCKGLYKVPTFSSHSQTRVGKET